MNLNKFSNQHNQQHGLDDSWKLSELGTNRFSQVTTTYFSATDEFDVFERSTGTPRNGRTLASTYQSRDRFRVSTRLPSVDEVSEFTVDSLPDGR